MKYVKVLFAWNIPRQQQGFFWFVSKLKLLRKGTISFHCTAVNEVYLQSWGGRAAWLLSSSHLHHPPHCRNVTSPSSVVLQLESFASQSCHLLIQLQEFAVPGGMGTSKSSWSLGFQTASGSTAAEHSSIQPCPAGIGVGKGKGVLPEAFLYATA